ncbi:MAG: aminoglycoside phosphotransferase family protein [Chitinophagaceae bacterium]|nr:aminoglycoside phosphotransferase family protein [Chitinophagaceae bacterium]
MLSSVLQEYGFVEKNVSAIPFGTGLINHTWKVITDEKAYILQRINDAVFKNPPDIAHNIRLLADHLAKHHPDYLFVSPVMATNGNDMVFIPGEGYFRLFPFIKGSHTVDAVHTAVQAYEAARQFGRFTKNIAGIRIEDCKTTIPGFHDLTLRHHQFDDALKIGNKARISGLNEVIRIVSAHTDILDVYEKIKTDPAFRLRIMHHDTKISNVLFDENNKGLCVIDLDTIMPGYFISDAGDMLRTYLSAANEEESDFDKMEVREDVYRAIWQGYMEEMQDELSDTEKKHFFYAGLFMVYMQALRFLTDYLNDDMYYGEKYPGHNLVRAKNQLALLVKLREKKKMWC